MHPTETERALAYALAVQTAFGNGLRGLLAMEAQSDPQVQACRVEIGEDGGIDVMLLNGAGMPIGGYSL
ncbi:hypothetical protein [Aquabacterium sp.]|uniref:hypothetical protein n=1 Tax=Aquabacterium sp. TaxID=1872578 RepID=UPI003783AA3A